MSLSRARWRTSPQVLLLDEPFGALDAKIREELRRTIRQVQRELKITTVLVTHDQEEAFALADRIGVMNLGRLLECGRPDELYDRPATRFVATFLGAANLLLAKQTEQGIRFGATPVNARRIEKLEGGREHEVVAVLRPEEIELAPTRDNLRTNYIATGVVEELVFTGALERIRVRMTSGPSDAHIGSTSPVDGHSTAAVLDITRTQHEQRSVPRGVRPIRGDRRATHSRAADAAVELHGLCRGISGRRATLAASVPGRARGPHEDAHRQAHRTRARDLPGQRADTPSPVSP